ncbi:hypothetical protein Pmani_028844 [Petrolisthes manimaculis]|uniref:Uncharacterized protein n=1 Tax=Petrolisthes manimaculis TaxID=1843537 RepID=A0AAE1P177_9EUCA|nr:hypothetical protein Pmani_028844 [Petrolisthes manimaculis]
MVVVNRKTRISFQVDSSVPAGACGKERQMSGMEVFGGGKDWRLVSGMEVCLEEGREVSGMEEGRDEGCCQMESDV